MPRTYRNSQGCTAISLARATARGRTKASARARIVQFSATILASFYRATSRRSFCGVFAGHVCGETRCSRSRRRIKRITGRGETTTTAATSSLPTVSVITLKVDEFPRQPSARPGASRLVASRRVGIRGEMRRGGAACTHASPARYTVVFHGARSACNTCQLGEYPAPVTHIFVNSVSLIRSLHRRHAIDKSTCSHVCYRL